MTPACKPSRNTAWKLGGSTWNQSTSGLCSTAFPSATPAKTSCSVEESTTPIFVPFASIFVRRAPRVVKKWVRWTIALKRAGPVPQLARQWLERPICPSTSRASRCSCFVSGFSPIAGPTGQNVNAKMRAMAIPIAAAVAGVHVTTAVGSTRWAILNKTGRDRRVRQSMYRHFVTAPRAAPTAQASFSRSTVERCT